ncbi:hypothetical protein ASF00_01065 [Sphingomonas sp. Leaf34]|uniref:hypothetical protein n=1 Tax=Sphingomonas sp. Leaf34 TaxID=1736216 RepID=UPI0006FC2F8C|nr:hypothetical protein [Sphingomonas sp. Leaf34]KQN31428.1 hypothetical protein ASF00_01065 [Sphingomonas sp. Leaf34]
MASAPAALPYQRVLLQGIDISANVRFVDVEDHDRLIDRAVVELDDPAGLASNTPREGNTLLVELGWSNVFATVFEGAITRVEIREDGCEPARVRFTALDFASRIQKRAFEATDDVGSLSSIVRTIVTRAPDAGVTVAQIEPAADPSYGATTPLRQTQDDWAFITEQSRRAGCIAFVEYNDARSQFYFVPLARLVTSEPVGTLSNIGTTNRILSLHLDRDAATADPRRGTATIDAATGATHVTAPPAAPAEPSQSPSARVLDAADRAGAPIDNAIAVAAQAIETPATLRPAGLAAGLSAGDAAQDPTRTLGWRARGSCVGMVNIRAKTRITLAGVASWAETDWYVRRARHRVATPGANEDMLASYVTEFELTR